MAELQVAVMGGTFDPIHYGHLRTASELRERLGYDQFRLIPSATPPHRASPLATAEDRWKMLQLALEEFPELTADRRELDRIGPSYTVDTLASLRKELGAQARLAWVVGMDAFCNLSTWHRWQELLDLAHIVVVARPGYSMPSGTIEAQLLEDFESVDRKTKEKAWHTKPAGNIVVEELRPYDISATEIRSTLGTDLGVKNTQGVLMKKVPERVLTYIRQQHLYGC